MARLKTFAGGGPEAAAQELSAVGRPRKPIDAVEGLARVRLGPGDLCRVTGGPLSPGQQLGPLLIRRIFRKGRRLYLVAVDPAFREHVLYVRGEPYTQGETVVRPYTLWSVPLETGRDTFGEIRQTCGQ